MKLIIDIPDEVYKRIIDYKDYDICALMYAVNNAINNGDEIPQGHGRIIDEQAIRDGKTNFSKQQGKWIGSDVPESILSKCSVCGFNCGAYTFNYCPMCGADMREADNDKVN